MNACIVKHINNFLQKQDLTKDLFCNKFNLNISTLNRLYSNDTNISLAFVTKIATILDLELFKLFK